MFGFKDTWKTLFAWAGEEQPIKTWQDGSSTLYFGGCFSSLYGEIEKDPKGELRRISLYIYDPDNQKHIDLIKGWYPHLDLAVFWRAHYLTIERQDDGTFLEDYFSGTHGHILITRDPKTGSKTKPKEIPLIPKEWATRRL